MTNLLFKDYRSLALCIFFSTLMLFSDVPIWCFVLSVLFWLWRIFCQSFNFNIPSKTITGFLAFLGLLVILIEFRTLLGKEPAASFIVILSGLKTLEFSQDNEKDFLVLLGFFLISSKFLFSYDLTYLLLSVPIYLTLTLNLFPSAWLKSHWSAAIKYLSKVLLLAAPMAALMFILFPRITKTLLELPSNYREGYSGFSDSISPGSIAKLSLNNEIVLRLEPFSRSLNMAELYISGLTLEKNNHMNWVYTKNNEGIVRSETPIEIDYKIILEPHNRNHLFSLKNTDRMSAEGLSIYHDSNYNFKLDTYLEKKAFIQASIASVKIDVTEDSLSRNLVEPDLSDLTIEQRKQIKDLNSQLRKTAKTPEEINDSILNYFATGRFVYTLNPGEQPQLNLYDFLFKYKKGYCEHFASALALLLRLNKVAARVVVGYHGGEFNPLGNFWTVRQKDAHAWVEFVNSSNRWVMADPVSVVAPQRIELGSNIYGSIVNDLLTAEEIKNRVNGADTLSRLSMWFDNVNYRWSSFLLEYDFDKQKDLLREFNLSLGSGLIVILIVLFLISVAINLFQKRGVKKKFSELCFQEINSWATGFNLQKNENEGPRHWQQRLLQHLPEKYRNKQAELEKAFSLWIEISFQKPNSNFDAKRSYTELKRALRRAR